MRRATKLTDDRTVKLPESVTQAAGWTSGQRLVPIVEGKSVVLVAIPEFGATKGIARAEEFDKLPAEQQLARRG